MNSEAITAPSLDTPDTTSMVTLLLLVLILIIVVMIVTVMIMALYTFHHSASRIEDSIKSMSVSVDKAVTVHVGDSRIHTSNEEHNQVRTDNIGRDLNVNDNG